MLQFSFRNVLLIDVVLGSLPVCTLPSPPDEERSHSSLSQPSQDQIGISGQKSCGDCDVISPVWERPCTPRTEPPWGCLYTAGPRPGQYY